MVSQLRRRLGALALSLLVAAMWPPPGGRGTAAQSRDNECGIQTSERVVAIGDVHGSYEGLLRILTAAGLADARGRWTGGRSVLVQTGDVLDRGGESRRVLDLLQKLEREAARAGGRVLALIGNHEVMRLVGDWRDVSEGEYAEFRNRDSEDLRERVYTVVAADAARLAKEEKRPHDEAAYREQFLRDIPLGFIEMRNAFDAKGAYGRWLRSRPAVVKVNGVVFLHGGVSEAVAALGCGGINDTVRKEIAGPPPSPEQWLTWLSTSETGPLWYRGLAQEPEETFAPTLEAILTALDARAIVVGHTPAVGRITPRFGGRVVQIDTGMLDGRFYPGGLPAALEIKDGSLTAIYPDRREAVAAPALAAGQ